MLKKTVTKEIWEAFDGKQFDTERDAIAHEREVIDANFSTEQLLFLLQERVSSTSCEVCPFHSKTNGDCKLEECFCDMF